MKKNQKQVINQIDFQGLKELLANNNTSIQSIILADMGKIIQILLMTVSLKCRGEDWCKKKFQMQKILGISQNNSIRKEVVELVKDRQELEINDNMPM